MRHKHDKHDKHVTCDPFESGTNQKCLLSFCALSVETWVNVSVSCVALQCVTCEVVGCWAGIAVGPKDQLRTVERQSYPRFLL